MGEADEMQNNIFIPKEQFKGDWLVKVLMSPRFKGAQISSSKNKIIGFCDRKKIDRYNWVFMSDFTRF